MKLIDTLLLAFSVGTLLISIDSIMRGNFHQNYWVLMLCLGSFFYYMYRKQDGNNQNEE